MQQRQSSVNKHLDLYGQKYQEKKKLPNETFLIQSFKDKVYHISKKINLSRFNTIETNNLEKQIDQIKSTSHPNIVKIRETFREKDQIILIIDYVGNQTLRIRSNSEHKITSQLAMDYLLQLLLALDHLEKQKFQTIPSIDIDSIYLNQYGSLRLSFTFEKKKTTWKDEFKKIGEIYQSMSFVEGQQDQLQEIQKLLLCEDSSTQQMLDHPYLLNAMNEIYLKSLLDKEQKELPKKIVSKGVHILTKDAVNKIVCSNPLKEVPVKEKAHVKEQALKIIYLKPLMNQNQKKSKSQLKTTDQKSAQHESINSQQHLTRQRSTSTITKKPSNEKIEKLDPKLQTMKPQQQQLQQMIIKQKKPVTAKGVIKNHIPLPFLKSPPKLVKISTENKLNLHQHKRYNSVGKQINDDTNAINESKDPLIQQKDYEATSFVFDLSCTNKVAKVLDSEEFRNMIRSEEKERETINSEQERIVKTEGNDESLDIMIEEVFSDEDTEDRELQIDTNSKPNHLNVKLEFCRTSRKQELQELLEIYKSQLLISASKLKGGCFLNLSEIQEVSQENSTISQSTFYKI